MSDHFHHAEAEPLDCESRPPSRFGSTVDGDGLPVGQFSEERLDDIVKHRPEHQEEASRPLSRVGRLAEGDCTPAGQFQESPNEETAQNPLKLQKDTSQPLSQVACRPDGDGTTADNLHVKSSGETEKLSLTLQENVSRDPSPAASHSDGGGVPASQCQEEPDQNASQPPAVLQEDTSISPDRVEIQTDGDGAPIGQVFEHPLQDTVPLSPEPQEGATPPMSHSESNAEADDAPTDDKQPCQVTAHHPSSHLEDACRVGITADGDNTLTIQVHEQPSREIVQHAPSPPAEAGEQPTDQVEVEFAPRPPQPGEPEPPLAGVQAVAVVHPAWKMSLTGGLLGPTLFLLLALAAFMTVLVALLFYLYWTRFRQPSAPGNGSFSSTSDYTL